MDDIQTLDYAWSIYRYHVEKFEHEMEGILRKKYPQLPQEKIDEKIYRAVERYFKQDSHRLLQAHLEITSLNRNI